MLDLGAHCGVELQLQRDHDGIVHLYSSAMLVSFYSCSILVYCSCPNFAHCAHKHRDWIETGSVLLLDLPVSVQILGTEFG